MWQSLPGFLAPWVTGATGALNFGMDFGKNFGKTLCREFCRKFGVNFVVLSS